MQLIQGVVAATKYLGIPRSTVQRHIKRGIFPIPTHTQIDEYRMRPTWSHSVLDNYKRTLRKPGRPPNSPQDNSP